MTAKTKTAGTKAKLTSSVPHHLGNDAVSCDIPAATGKIEEMKKNTAVTIARRRFRCGLMRCTLRLRISQCQRNCAYLSRTGDCTSVRFLIANFDSVERHFSVHGTTSGATMIDSPSARSDLRWQE